MKNLILAGALACAHGLAADLTAQTPLPLANVFAVQATTIEGCLRAGSADGEFIVSTGGERHTVIAGQGVDLAAHVNHRVQLTGALEKAQVGQVFRVTALKMVATTCNTP